MPPPMDTRRPTLLVMEPNAAGHHAAWVRWISAQMVGRGWKVVVATHRKSLDETSFAWLADRGPHIDVVSTDVPFDDGAETRQSLLLWNEVKRHRFLHHLYRCSRRSHNADAVLLPYGDYIMHAVALLGSPFGATTWVTVVMRPTFHHRSVGIKGAVPPAAWLRQRLFMRFLRSRSLLRCFTVDETLYHYARSLRAPSLKALASKVEYLPDPAPDMPPIGRADARRMLGLSAQATLVLLFGMVGERKGVHQLIAALHSLRRPELQALIVGVVEDDARAALNSPEALELKRSGRLHLIDGWVGDETESAAFSAADIAWLGYRGHWRSSGVLVQAARAGLPLLACDDGIIGWLTRRYECGLTVPVLDHAEVVRGLERLASGPSLRRELGDRAQEAFARHSVDDAAALLANVLEGSVSCEPHERAATVRSA
jgi:glycosyltransferase involved in cell wall biosynthesis